MPIETGRWPFKTSLSEEGMTFDSIVGNGGDYDQETQIVRMANVLINWGRRGSGDFPVTYTKKPGVYGADRKRATLQEAGDAARALIAYERNQLTEYEYSRLPDDAKQIIRWRAESIEKQKEEERRRQEGSDLISFGDEAGGTEPETTEAREGLSTGQKVAAAAGVSALIYMVM